MILFWHILFSWSSFGNTLLSSSSQNVTINKTTPQFFTGRMSYLLSNEQCQSSEGKTVGSTGEIIQFVLFVPVSLAFLFTLCNLKIKRTCTLWILPCQSLIVLLDVLYVEVTELCADWVDKLTKSKTCRTYHSHGYHRSWILLSSHWKESRSLRSLNLVWELVESRLSQVLLKTLVEQNKMKCSMLLVQSYCQQWIVY